MAELPKDFLDKMKTLLKGEYQEFLDSYEDVRVQGLRVNTLKISVEDFQKLCPFELERIPWTDTGFYYKAEDRPGKHPYHEAGLYYIQEPSAMSAAEALDPRPGEKILDLSAAPGGKTTQIAAKMKQQGLLVANEIHPERARILSQNVERMGIKNAVVTNETPDRLAQRFTAFFDRIIVDAPCSGEGMFRKDPDVCEEWSLENVALCATRQMDILTSAAPMLKEGGRLVYSTCTFSPEENEELIEFFLAVNRDFELISIERFWPHKVKGEGHFVAVLKRTKGEKAQAMDVIPDLTDKRLLDEYFKFANDNLSYIPEGKHCLFGDQLYIVPNEMIPLKGLKVIRPGWHLGTLKKNRFEPSHSLALALTGVQVKHRISFGRDSSEIVSYLKGQTLSADGQKGWYIVEVDGHSIGWGKLSDGVLKNHYPKGLRWN